MFLIFSITYSGNLFFLEENYFFLHVIFDICFSRITVENNCIYFFSQFSSKHLSNIDLLKLPFCRRKKLIMVDNFFRQNRRFSKYRLEHKLTLHITESTTSDSARIYLSEKHLQRQKHFHR